MWSKQNLHGFRLQLTLVPIHHLSISTAKLVHQLFYGIPFALERARIAVIMDCMWLHVVLVFVEIGVEFF